MCINAAHTYGGRCSSQFQTVPLSSAALLTYPPLEAASSLATYTAIPENNQTQEIPFAFYLCMRDKLEIARFSLSTQIIHEQ
jgi:hypothetical protein